MTSQDYVIILLPGRVPPQSLYWPGWLTYSGWFTHISGHPSAAGRAQDSESSPVTDRRSTTVPRNQQTDKPLTHKPQYFRCLARTFWRYFMAEFFQSVPVISRTIWLDKPWLLRTYFSRPGNVCDSTVLVIISGTYDRMPRLSVIIAFYRNSCETACFHKIVLQMLRTYECCIVKSKQSQKAKNK